TRTLALDPNFTQARSWRAIALAKTGRHRQAAEDADRAAREEPRKGLTLFFAARAYAQAVKAALADENEPKREELAEKYGKRVAGRADPVAPGPRPGVPRRVRAVAQRGPRQGRPDRERGRPDVLGRGRSRSVAELAEGVDVAGMVGSASVSGGRGSRRATCPAR